MNIADLHCDLLSFLIGKGHKGTNDPLSKGSYPLMRKGKVALQVLPIYTETKKGSSLLGKAQWKAFQDLLEKEPSRYKLFTGDSIKDKQDEAIWILPSIENGSGLVEEDGALETALTKLDEISPLYISLTWNEENRFGGGNSSSSGIKPDGKILLEHMDGKKIAIDLSHTSDFLAHDILNHIEKKSLKIPVIASHSNTRSMVDQKRNLPDLFLKEIIKRKGLIGLNLFSPFLGKKAEDAAMHVQHILSLGGEDALSFGADFFPDPGFEHIKKKYGIKDGFFPKLYDASCYQTLVNILKQQLLLDEAALEKIAYGNIEQFYSSI